MSSDVFWKSPPWRHLNAVSQVNCSTRLVHWQQNSCHRRLSVCAEQTAGTRWLIADVNGRSSTCSTQTYSGASPWRHLKTRTAVLNLILCRTGSQWSSRITSVMRRSNRYIPNCPLDRIFLGRSGSQVMHGSMDLHESTRQTASQSLEPFFDY